MPIPPSTRPPRIVVAGGGVGGVEAVLALRALLGEQVSIALVAPEQEFVYRALSVAEPFGYRRALRVPLSRLADTHAIVHLPEQIVGVRPEAHELDLSDGECLAYDKLIVAVGARQEAWLEGALCFTGPPAVGHMRELLARIAAGAVQELTFAAPTTAWTLPLYELALLTATWCADEGVVGLEMTVATPEEHPLELFGRAASRTVRDLLSDRGIRFHGRMLATPATVHGADAVVTLPRLRPTPVGGLPVDAAGFIPVDEHAAVLGVPDVYAVGDATNQPIKQGGLATQQADCAAAAIAHALGAPVEPEPFRPVLRGLVLGGMSAAFLRRDEMGAAESAFDALWWPPTKVAGRHLGPYLTDAQVAPGFEDTATAARDRAELRRIVVELARSEAGWGDHAMALRWLETVEWLDGVLPPDLAVLRRTWEARRDAEVLGAAAQATSQA